MNVAEEPERPSKVGPYAIGRHLGNGAFGHVWTATANSVLYAVKRIEKNEKTRKEKFEKEVQTLRKLNHTNIVTYKDHLLIGDYFYIIMEYCVGGDLLTYLRKSTDGHLTEKQARSVFRQLAQAIHYLFKHNIIHRDIKTGNILLNANENFSVIKLADFGFARALFEEMGAKEAVDYLTLFDGTTRRHRSVAAPEMSTGEYNYKVDLWSAGAVFYACLYGNEALLNTIYELKGFGETNSMRDIQNEDFPDNIHIERDCKEVLKTDPPVNVDELSCAVMPNVVTTVDFAPDKNTTIDQHFTIQDNVSGGAPHVCSEFYDGWFLAWGWTAPRTIGYTEILLPALDYIHNAKNGSANLYSVFGKIQCARLFQSILYIILGSTNFAFWGENMVATSYWSDAPIADNGDITAKYWAIRNFIGNLTDWDYPPATVPDNVTTASYGQVSLKQIGTNLVSTLAQIQLPCVQSPDPITFAHLNYGNGYVLYTTTLQISGKTLHAPYINDFGYVYLNNVYQGVLKIQNATSISFFTTAQPGDILRILVENIGRGYFKDNKGLSMYPGQNVFLDGKVLENWIQCGINLTSASINSLTQRLPNTDINNEGIKDVAAATQPGVYSGTFTASPQQDTYLDTTGWGKGNVFINGFNLGRYWPALGPQMTLYVPKPVLQDTNTILLIELLGAQQTYVNFIDHAIFVFKNNTI